LPKILLVDDHQIVRKQLHYLLERQDAWQICGEAENGKQAVTKFADTHPDITIMDFVMPEMNGLEASRKIIEKYPGSLILMVSIDTSDELANAAKKAGIRGICPKNQILHIVDGILALLNGQTYYRQD